MSSPASPFALALLSRLHERPEHTVALAALLVDDIFTRPMSEILEPERAASSVVAALVALSESPDLEGWLVKQERTARARLEARSGCAADILPATALAPLQSIASRPFTPDREIVAALLDHDALRNMVRAVLTSTLTDFAAKLRASMPGGDGPPRFGGGGLGALAGLAKGVAGAVAGAVEKTFEERARSYVEGAIGTAIEMSLDRISDPAHAAEMAQWRVEVLNAALTLPFAKLATQREQLDPEVYAQDTVELIKALASDHGLATLLERELRIVLDVAHDSSLDSFLAGTGAGSALRSAVQAWLADRLTEFFHTPGFAAWLSVWLDDE